MATVATAYVQVVPSLKGVGSAIESAFTQHGERAGRVAGQQSGQGFKTGLNAVTGAIVGVSSQIASRAFNMISSSIGGAVSRVDQLNNFPKVMKNLGYSSSQAGTEIKRMSDRLAGLPTSLDAMTGMVQIIAPVTGSLHDATSISLAFNDALLAGGKSTIEQANALQQYSQMLANGKPDMQSWRSMQTAMPGQLDQIAKKLLGTAANSMDLYQAMQKGKISFKQFNDALVELDSKGLNGFASFQKQAKDATGGIATQFTNMQTAIKKGVADIIQALGADGIGRAIGGVGVLFKNALDMVAHGITVTKTTLASLFTVLQNNGAISTLSKAFTGLVDTVKSVASTLFTSVNAMGKSSSAASLLTVAVRALASVLNGVKNVVQLFGNVVKFLGDHVAFTKVVVAGLLTSFAGFKIIKTASTLITGLSASFSTLKTAQGAITGCVSALQGFNIIKGVTTLVGGFSSAFSAFKTAQSLIAGCTGAFKAFSLALGVNPFILIATGIAAATAALAYFFSQTKTGQKMWQQFMNFLKPIWGNIVKTWTPVIESVKNVFQAVFPAVQKTVGTVLQSMMQMWQAFAPVVTTIVNALGSLFQAVFPLIATIVGTQFKIIATVITTVMNTVGPLITTVVNAISAVFQAVFPVVSTVVTTAFNIINTIITTVLNAISPLISTTLNVIKTVFTTVFNAVATVVSTVFHAIQATISTIINVVSSVISTTLHTISSTWSSVWNAVSSFFSNIWHTISSTCSNGINSVVSFFSGMFGRIKSAIGNAGSWLIGVGRSIIQGLLNGINSAWHWVTDKLASLSNLIPGFLKKALGINSPSRVMRDMVGVFIPEGVAAGIEDGLGSVHNAMGRLHSQIMDDKPIIDDALGVALPDSRVALTADSRLTVRHQDETKKMLHKFDELTKAVQQFDSRMPHYIAKCTPVLGDRDFDRRVRNAFA